MVSKADIQKAIEEAKSNSEQRKFRQSMDLIINFSGVDFSKPDQKLSVEAVLPKGPGKDVRVCVIADKELMKEAKDNADHVISASDLGSLQKKDVKRLARQYRYFIAQASLMPSVGKVMGQVLAPRGQMPRPVPPNAKLGPLVKRLKNIVVLKPRGKFMPVLQAMVGKEDMESADLAENAWFVINSLKEKMSKGSIDSICIKTTMGKPSKLRFN